MSAAGSTPTTIPTGHIRTSSVAEGATSVDKQSENSVHGHEVGGKGSQKHVQDASHASASD
jgi:hypothetical protein